MARLNMARRSMAGLFDPVVLQQSLFDQALGQASGDPSGPSDPLGPSWFEEDQLPLFDYVFDAPAESFAIAGSKRWLQVAINRAPELLNEALRPLLPLQAHEQVAWRSPRAITGFREYRDMRALRQLGIHSLPQRPLRTFWPVGGPMWDALAKTSGGQFIFLEAKAHLAEAASPGTGASDWARGLICKSLCEARQHYAPASRANWSGTYYQYANRLAHHYLFHTLNGLPSHLVFLYFLNAAEMHGPTSPWQWERTIRRLHRALGLPHRFQPPRVHDVFLDVTLLSDLL